MATDLSRPKPYIAAATNMREFTPRAVIVGTLLGVIFGASSLYLVLKVGLTVSASIPVAVISVTLFRLWSKVGGRDSSILENNIVQTAGSAGESIAFGIGVTMPAILILGFDLEIGRVILVAVLGGLLGILMMIPLRRALIDNQHHVLKYPEGTACAEVLKAGASDESRAAAGLAAADKSTQMSGAAIFGGFLVGFFYKLCMSLFALWKEAPEKIFGRPLKNGSVSAEISPELLGVGYIIGPRVAFVMCAGGVMAYLVLIPMITFFGENLAVPLAPAHDLIRNMSPDDIRGGYVLYIGAGAVAAGGIISLVRSMPTIWHGLQSGLRDLRGGGQSTGERTDKDLSMGFVLIGILTLVAAILLAPQLHMNLLGAILIVVFGFLFVTVSSRLTGEIGSSSNPISGMTVATLLLTCLVFLVIGWTGNAYYVTALSVGAVVCIAASNGGTTSQDLKTGWLVGGTPKLQQVAILIGAGASALALGPILLKLNDGSTVYAPQTIVAEYRAEEGQPETLSPGVLSTLAAYSEPGPKGAFKLYEGREGEPLGSHRYLVGADGKIVYRLTEAFSSELRVDPSALATAKTESLVGEQAAFDNATYLVWRKPESDSRGPEGKYLVERNGTPRYLVDPGINGIHELRPDGSKVFKYKAPKATLMSYIIKGILSGNLPWALVLLGVMIAVMLEMAGIPSLAFAVGVYLPLSSSTPILAGGIVRWLVDRKHRPEFVKQGLNEEQITAEGDKSSGVLLGSGLIAGGSIAGILIAFASGFMGETLESIHAWASRVSPMVNGPHADLLSMIPFVAVAALLYFIGVKRNKQPA